MRRLVAFLSVVLLCGCGESGQKSAVETASPGAVTNSPPAQEIFENITGHSGVQFVHQTGTNYFMADQIGSGVALLDFDQDGRLDLYFVQNVETGHHARNRLYHQQPDGRFKDVSAGSGLDISGRGMSAIAGDINNDGAPDVIVTEYGATRVFQNVGLGKFREVKSEGGVDNPRWAGPASFVDFDRDGWLDLVVGNYVDYDPTQVCHDRQGHQEFCAPQAFPATAARLWRNVTHERGAQPKFEDWTVKSGIFRNPGVALGLVCGDFTGDGWPDIFCSDDGRPNRLFVNQRDGTFTEEAARRGLAYDAMGRTAANMGVAFADLTEDGLADLFITHLTEEFHSFFRQDRPGLFADAIAQSGMQQQSWRGTGFGTVAADFDLDGDLDIAFVNGLIRRGATEQAPVGPGMNPWWERYAQRPQLFIKDGDKFKDDSLANPAFCGQAAVGRSLAVGDLDNNGAPDLVAGNIGGPAQIFRNVARSKGHWLKLRLLDPAAGGRDAIGAEVRLRAGDRSWWTLLQPATSYFTSNDPAVHFGLGANAEVESAEILWPDGEKESFDIAAVNQLLVLKKGSGQKKSE